MTRRQVIISLVLGVGLWFVAARFVHYLPELFAPGTALTLLFAGAIATGAATVAAAQWLGKPDRPQLVAMLSLGTAAALVLDGLGIAFFPSLYAGESTATQYGAAWIMWAAGLGLLFSFWRGAR